MTKLSSSLGVTAALLLGPVACEREVQREAEDVEDAREEVREQQRELREEVREQKQEIKQEKQDLREEQAELAAEMQEELSKAEARYTTLSQQAEAVTKPLDVTQGPGAAIHQAAMLAKAKLEAARTAETSEQKRQALIDAKDALDRLEERLDEYQDEV